MIKSRTIFIGDVHGCYNELKLLLKKLDIQPEDIVYFVGDLINKGPKSYKVVKLLYKNKEQFKSIKGNHEMGFLNWLEGKAPQYSNKIFTKLKTKLELKPEILEYIKNLPIYIETNDFILLHGGFMFDKKLEDHSEIDLVNLRDYNGKPWYEYYNGEKKIIYGHNAIDGLMIREKTIGLESGCVYGKALTAYILETGDVVQQNALKIHINPYKTKENILDNIKKNIFKFKKGN